MFFKRTLVARDAIAKDHSMQDRLRHILRAHHERRGEHLRVDTKKNTDKAGSNRAVYGMGTVSIEGTPVHIVAKAAIPGRDAEDGYSSDGSMVAYELGAFEHLAEGDKTPAFGIPVKYSHHGQAMFALLVEDLTRGGTCRLESEHLPLERRNHQVVQISPDGTRVEIWADLKAFSPFRPEFVDVGEQYLVPQVAIDVGAI